MRKLVGGSVFGGCVTFFHIQIRANPSLEPAVRPRSASHKQRRESHKKSGCVSEAAIGMLITAERWVDKKSLQSARVHF